MNAPLLSVENLVTAFRTRDGSLRAVNDLSFQIAAGEVFAVVGESGSGKSMTALSILGLVPGPAGGIESGEIYWQGRNLVGLRERELRRIRGAEIAMIFQDPMTSLNPVYTIGEQIIEVVRVHEGLSRSDARKRAIESLDAVGIPQADKRMKSYPHEFSGGMRQRAMIAMAIACKPKLLIADEPTTALDVTIQAQVLELLQSIRQATATAIMLITHDLGVVAGVADRVMVMYAGRAVESGRTADVFDRTRHPYTLGLLASLPRLDAEGRSARLRPISGSPPSLRDVPPGCPFHPRCPFARLPAPCASEIPDLRTVEPDQRAACHFAESLAGVRPHDLPAGSTAP